MGWKGDQDVQHEVGVDDVVERLEEDGEEAEAGEEARERGRDPVDVAAVAGPCEPEQPDGEGGAPGDDGGEAPFRQGDVVVGGEFAVVGRLEEDDDDAGGEHAGDGAEEGQAADARVEAVDLLEDDGVGGEEEVEQPVNEGHVDAQQEHDGFRGEDAQRPAEVLAHEFRHVHFDFLLLGVDAPVLGTAPQLRGFLDQDHGRVGFLQEEEIEQEREEAHDGDDVFRPAPAEVGVHDDEAANEGGQERA